VTATTDSHAASVTCAVEPPRALEFLADGIALGGWALGCFDTEEVAPGVFRGTALDSGAAVYVRIVPRSERGEIVYEVGADPAALEPRIRATVTADGDLCVVTLFAERTASMSDADWARTRTLHEAEVLLIGDQLARSSA